MNILIVEDDPWIASALAEILGQEGHECRVESDGEAGVESFLRHQPDFLFLDIMMPKLSGYDVCRQVRASGSSVPIIFISAKSEEIDRVLGLELGADDFIQKPFGVREVLARFKAVNRRTKVGSNEASPLEPFSMGDLTVDPAALRAHRDSQSMDLSARDLSILSLLKEREGQPVDRQTFFDRCWGFDFVPNSRSLDQHISQLRRRIEVDPKHPRIIQTVRGVGYRYEINEKEGKRERGKGFI